MTITMQLITFKTCFGNNEAKNTGLIFAFSLTDRKIAIAAVKRTLSGDFLPCLLQAKFEKSIVAFTYVFLFRVCQCNVL